MNRLIKYQNGNKFPKVTLVDSDKVRMNNSVFFDENGNIIGDSVVLPDITIKPSTPQTNSQPEYERWLLRESERGGRNFSANDREAYDKMMRRIANQNEVKNFTGFDSTVYKHGSGALELVSPEFDILTLGRQFYTDGLFKSIGKNASKKVSKKTPEQLPLTQWTPEQWTAAQDAAIARGDMAEAQRLRDLHFQVSAPNTQIKDIQYHGSKGNAKFNVFDPNLIGQTDKGWAGRGYYFTPSEDYAKMYGLEPRAFYINAQKVHDGTAATYFGRENSPAANAFKIIRKRHNNDGQQILDELASSDAIRTSFSQTQPYNGTFEEVVTRNNNQMKLADAVTYDDNGVRIPLGLRDNFRSKDIRYGLIPLSIGGTALSNQYANGGSIHISPLKRGTFTAATKHGNINMPFYRKYSYGVK